MCNLNCSLEDAVYWFFLQDNPGLSGIILRKKIFWAKNRLKIFFRKNYLGLSFGNTLKRSYGFKVNLRWGMGVGTSIRVRSSSAECFQGAVVWTQSSNLHVCRLAVAFRWKQR